MRFPAPIPVCALLGVVLLGAGAGPARSAGAASPHPGPAPAEVVAARRLLRQQQTVAAFRLLERAGGFSAAAPERTWVLGQVAGAVLGRSALRRRLHALEPGDLREALLALAHDDPAAALAGLAARAGRSAEGWSALAAAQLALRCGEGERSLAYAERARASPRPFVRVEGLLSAARALGELKRLPEAAASAERAFSLDPADSRALSLRAELERRQGRLAQAREALAGALERDPDSAPYARRMAELLREAAEPGEAPGPGTPALLERLQRLPPSSVAEREALAALVALGRGRADEARTRLSRALAMGAHPVPLEHELRVLLARAGEHRALVDHVERALPPELPFAAENALAPRWRELRGAVEAAPDGFAPAPAQARLFRALLALGALEEARAVGARLPPEHRAAVEALARHLAFEARLRALVEGGYRAAATGGASPGLAAFRERLAAEARALLPEPDARLFEPHRGGLESMGPLGRWLGHGARHPAPAVAYFRRFGRYLVLGQRADQPVEAILLALGYLAPSARVVTGGRVHAHDTAVGYHRVLRGWLDAQGGSLAGACLPDGLWLDAEAALDAEHDLRAGLTLEPALAAAQAALPPPPPEGRAGVLGLSDPAGVGTRLSLRHVARRGAERWGSFRTLWAHENGHVTDLRRHLPLLRGLPATLALLGSVGFCPRRMEAVLERRAQLTALAEAPDPAVALAEMIALLPQSQEREPEVHAAGYRDALARLVGHVAARPDLYPAIDPRAGVLAQLDRLSDDDLRRAARAVLRGS